MKFSHRRHGETREKNFRFEISNSFSATSVAIAFFLLLSSVAFAQQADTQPDADAQKVKVAIFPLGGSADDAARDKVGFALRMKLDRTDIYDAIDGPTMADMVSKR